MKANVLGLKWSVLGLLGYVFVLGAGSVMAQSASKSEAKAKEEAELMAEITISPARLAPESTINLVFPTPMVKAEAVGKPASVSPLKIEPALVGVFEWTSSRSGLYKLKQVPRFSQDYVFQLNDGLLDLEGKKLSTDLLDTVSTGGFSVVDQDPKWFGSNDIPRRRALLFQFNDQVNALDAAAHMVFRSTEPAQTVPVTVRHAEKKDLQMTYGSLQPTWTEAISGVEPKLGGGDKRLSALLVEPAEPLPVAASWELVILDTLTNSSGQSKLEKEQVVKLGAVLPFKVKQVTGHTPFDRPYHIDIEFTKRVKSAPAGKTPEETAKAQAGDLAQLMNHLVVEPEVAHTRVELLGDVLRLHGDFRLGMEYRVTVTPGIEAWDDLRMEEPLRDEGVTFQPNPPYVSAPAFARSQLARGTGVFEVTAANVTHVRVRAKKLNGPQLLEARELYRGYDNAFERKLEKRRAHQPESIEKYPGDWMLDREFKVNKALDQSDMIQLNWRELLSDSGGAGAVFLEFEGFAMDGLEDDRIITQSLIESTDLGLMVKASGKEQLIFVTHLESGQPAKGARITLLDRDRKLLGHGETDGNGVARIVSAEAVYVLAELGHDCAVLDTLSGGAELWSVYGDEINRSWRNVWQPSRKTFVFSDRDLYRPGDTMYLKAMTRLQVGDSLSLEGQERKARLKLRDSRYRLIRNEEITFSANGSFTTELKLPEGPLGSYDLNIEFASGEADEDESSGAYYTFRVDDYRPNTFEVEIKTAQARLEKDRIQVPLSARYYMGKPLTQADIEWHAFSVPGFEPPAEFSDYHFGDAPGWAGYGNGEPSYSSDESEWFVSGDVMLSDDGTAILLLPMPPPHRSAFPQLVEINTDLTDLNQQTISSHATLRVPGAKILPGIRESDSFGQAGEPLRLELAVLDGEGKPAPGAVSAEVVVERQEYQSVKVAAAGSATTTETSVVLHEEKRETVSVSGKPSSYSFTPTRGGSYFVTITTQDSDGVKAFSRLPIHVIGKGEYPWRIENGVRLTLQPESKEVKPGGEAVIAIQCPIEGTALITVERNRMHQHFVKPYKLDDPVIRIPVGESDAPNIFVSVVVVRGAAASGKQFSLPEYRVGYTEILVPSDAQDLLVAVTPEKPEVLPGSDLPVAVTVKDARGTALPGADVTLFAVDEGVLSLTGFETPDPDDYFHQLFQLAFSNYTSLENLLPEAQQDRVRSNKGFLVGGGGDEGAAPEQMRKNFVATPLWIASALTDAEGRTVANVKVPDNLTRYRLMAVVSSGAERFGRGESAFTVNKPLMVEPVVPRFARLGDEVLVKGILHNTTLENREVELSLQLGAGAAFITEARAFAVAVEAGTDPTTLLRKVSVPAGASLATVFPVRFDGLGETVWTWKARSVGGSQALADATESRFEVAHPVPELREVRYARITNPTTPVPVPVPAPAPATPPAPPKKGDTKAKAKAKPQPVLQAEPTGPMNLLAKVNPEILEAQGAVQINLTTTRLTEVRDGLDYLLQYPYGCVEQTTSATMPWLALGGFHTLFPQQLDPAHSREAVQKGVNRLLQMVVEGEGGLAYWPGGSEPNRWGSAYGGLMLLRARDSGASMPTEVVESLMDYLAKQLRGLDTETDSYVITDAALSLYTLAKAKRAEPAYHTLLFERRARLPEAAKLYLGLAMLISEAPHDQVKALLGVGAPGDAAPAPTGSRHWAGDGPNKALRLLAYTHMGLAQSADALANEIWAARNLNGEWGNTYSNAWTLTALAAYERSRKATGRPIEAVIAWGDTQEKVNLSAEQPLAQVTLPLETKRAQSALTVEIPKDESVWVRTEVRAHPRSRDFAGENHGYAITRDYRKVMPDGGMGPAEDLRVGDLVRVSLGIEIAGGDRYLAIEDALPSVLEPMNPEFETQNVRQDGPFDDYEPWFCDHRELHANRALFFTDHAPSKGKFVLHYLARVIAEGDTVAPPAKIEAMYEPSKYGLSPTQRVITLPGVNAKVAGP